MTRSLLPYEYELVEALGVTEEEYLDFLSIQAAYCDPKEGTIYDTRSILPAAGVAAAAALTGGAAAKSAATTLAVVSLSLTVVGVLFQVAAALLAPKPPSPTAGRNQRDQRFSPRFGFNSSQELGQYGDPINLVYCNTTQNPKGAVRVGTSLVWSSVESYGSTQFMQLLLVLGAAKIKALDFDRTAFGQLPLGQFSASNTWLYYEDDGPVNFNDKVLGDGKDPTRDGAADDSDVCRVMFAKERHDGYSQAFSPSSLTSFGVYDPIPLNVEIMERDSVGNPRWRDLRVTIAANNYDTNDGARWEVGRTFTVIFSQTDTKRNERVAVEAARDMRYQLVSSLDQAATYMLGTAKFKLLYTDPDNMNLDKNAISAKFECIETGRRPSTDYTKTKSKTWKEEDIDDIEDAIDKLEAEASYYLIIPSNDSEVFSARANNGDIQLNLKDYGYKNYNFTDTKNEEPNYKILRWTNELDQKKYVTLPNGGSIATTEQILEEFIANKPKLDTQAVKDEIKDDMRRLRNLIDSIQSGEINGQEFRKLAKQAGANIATQIDVLQSKKKEKLNELDINKDQLEEVKKATSGNVKVLGEKTGLKKSQLQDLLELERQINKLQDDRQDLMTGDIAKRTAALISFYRNESSPFTNRSETDNNRYGSGGLKAMERRLSKIKGRFTTDQIGVGEVRDYLRDLIEEKTQALDDAKKIEKDWETLAGAGDDNFFTKCFVKAESAAYQTVTACDYVKFAIRCKLFRRVSGRAQDYGQKEAPEGFKLSDNGIKGRMAFFKVAYKKTDSNRENYRTLPIVFAVRRNADQDNFIGLAFKGNEQAKWEFKIEPIGDIGAEIQDNGQTEMAFIENAGKMEIYDHAGSSFAWTGSLVNISGNIKDALKERGPIYTNEWDLFSVRSDTQVQFSFDGGPEFRITAVTEQQIGDNDGKYASMSMMALGIFSGRGVQDLRSITGYVTQGKESWIVNDNGTRTRSADSTSYAPDIFADTILDSENGIGKFAKSQGVDWDGVALAKRFCANNGLGCQLFMDGVISEQTPWRQFWAETAPFSLLEFARVGGRETLIPAVPVNSAGVANRQVTVNALFTAGNVLEGSYKEEFIDYGSAVQDLIASVIYRETESQDVFPRNSSVTVSLKDVDDDTAILQSFDLSQFVTQREQAILFGKLVCNQRRHIRRGIEFRTFPTDTPISPGAYIYVDIGLNSWDRRSSGLIMKGGALNAPLTDGIINGSYSVLIYRDDRRSLPYKGPEGETIYEPVTRSFDNISVSNGIAAALAPYAGYMFVLGAKSDRKRVFRVVEVQMDEEGEITVKAMEHPCDTSGSLLLSRIANFSGSLFDVR